MYTTLFYLYSFSVSARALSFTLMNIPILNMHKYLPTPPANPPPL